MRVIDHRIALLKEEVRQLHSLLENPEPGIRMWTDAIHKRVEEINAIMDGKRDA